MSVSYEQAMQTLVSMFGTVDREVIAMLLQNNKGHMENTIENLLAMTAGPADQAPPPRQQPQQPQARGSAPQPARASQQQGRDEHKSGHPPSSASQRRPAADPSANDVYKLPSDFLQPPSYFEAIVGPAPELMDPQMRMQRKSSNVEEIQAQIDQDHLLAQMLQDEQFMADLANNPERYGQQGGGGGAPPRQQQQQSQPQQQHGAPVTPARVAPPAHPHPDFDQVTRKGSAAAPPPIFATPSASSSSSSLVAAPASAALVSPLIAGSLPVNDKLRSLEYNDVVSHSGGGGSLQSGRTTKEQQSSFKQKWDALGAAAREKLARLSKSFKKQAEYSEGGGDYAEMQPIDDGRPGRQRKGGADDDESSQFISEEEAVHMQASYNPPMLRSSSEDQPPPGGRPRANPYAMEEGHDDRDPFGRGANGSDGEEEEADLNRFLKSKQEERRQQQQQRSAGAMEQEMTALPGVVRLQGIQPEAIILSPSQFQRGSASAGFASPSDIAAVGRSKDKQRTPAAAAKSKSPDRASMAASGHSGSGPALDPPSDEDDDGVSPAAKAKRKEKERYQKGIPLLQDL